MEKEASKGKNGQREINTGKKMEFKLQLHTYNASNNGYLIKARNSKIKKFETVWGGFKIRNFEVIKETKSVSMVIIM